MALIRAARRSRLLAGLLSDESLTHKAYLNALAAGLDYAAQLMVGFFVTPWVVAGLGDYRYGLWQLLNRLVGYLSPASGKPTQALRWTLAYAQSSTDYDLKRRQVGSAIAAWSLFVPLTGVIGAILSWFAPDWLAVPQGYYGQVRLTAGLLVADLIMINVSALPRAVLQGENLGYKRMGLSALLVFVGGGFTLLALELRTGLVGVAAAAVASTLLSGLLFLLVVRSYVPWFGVVRPPTRTVLHFMRLSGWFLGWDLVTTLMLASDVVVLGLLNSVASVTPYSLTKYAPETLISVVAIVVSGIVPGLGGIIGAGDLQKAARVRGEIMVLTWLILTALGSAVLLWNRAFIGMWVGARQYAGAVANLAIVAVVAQLVLIRTDASIIDLTLRLERKVLMGALSVALSLIIACILVGYFRLGVVGLCLGLMAGRAILSIGYPLLIGRFLGVSLATQLRRVWRPAAVTLLLFALAAILDSFAPAGALAGLRGWLIFFLSAGATFCLTLVVAFLTGLTDRQRRSVWERIRTVLNAGAR